jgi:5-oxoprolinase (ATP-hydrolysing) subunit A
MSARNAIDINVDMGESFGRWSLGDDAALMPHISSASIACGYHAGDPGAMRRTVAAAVEHGLQIGAHVSFPDLLGFGRRQMKVAPEDLTDYCTYQIGALAAFVCAEGGNLAHVKPHGALYAMASSDGELAGAVARSVAEVDDSMLLLLLRAEVEPAVAEHGIRLVTEAFPDLAYEPDGNLVMEAVKEAWNPDEVARRAVRVAVEQKIDARDGTDLAVDVPTVCLHGDAPNAPEVAGAVARALRSAGVSVTPMAEIVNGSA